MIYFGNPSSDEIRKVMSAPRSPLGMITTPKQGNRVPAEATFCADNGCYGRGYPGDEAWLEWLASKADPRCRFATAPDVVGDAKATLERSLPWLPRIRELGLPAAFVAQDGLEFYDVPWPELDALFIGGSTMWKLSSFARELVEEAKRRDKWVHLGRVNSRKRVLIARDWGCDSVDGTFLAFGPYKNLPECLRWMDEVNGTDWEQRVLVARRDTEREEAA